MTPCRVVVVDDAPDVRILLRAVLEEEGVAVVGEARNGTEAIDVARREKPDVTLLDLSMPVMNGLEALPLVVEASPETAVVVLSGFVDDDVRGRVVGLGASACVEKGTNLDGLLAAVRDLCPGAEGRTRAADEPAEAPPPPVVASTPRREPEPSAFDADDLVPVLMHELSPAVAVLRRSLDAFAEVRAADAGRLDIRPEPVELDRLVRDVLADLQSVTDDHRVDVVVESGVAARVDRGRLRQVLANLLSNAAKFSPPETPIEVDVGLGDGQALVWVRDRGRGVPPGASEEIFRKYARLGNAPGMGLGLYVARAIVEAHGGDLTVEHAEGGGARFVVRLPLA